MLKIVVGLGNPGEKYSKTRHNIGFMVIDKLTCIHNLPLNSIHKDYIFGLGEIGKETIIMAKPLTYMNRSGMAVKEILKKFSLKETDLIVIQDDIDLEIGKIKIKKEGRHGGHNGIRSIIESINSDKFIRVKIGVGRDVAMDPADYLLRPFKKDEREIIDVSIEKAGDIFPLIISGNISEAMNRVRNN